MSFKQIPLAKASSEIAPHEEDPQYIPHKLDSPQNDDSFQDDIELSEMVNDAYTKWRTNLLIEGEQEKKKLRIQSLTKRTSFQEMFQAGNGQ